MDFTGKKALITGANRGIGFAIAKELSQRGCELTLAGRNLSQMQEAADSLDGSIHCVQWEAGNVSEFPGKIEEAARRMGGLDILVNNAGVVPESDRKGIFALTEEDWDLAMDVNLKATFFMCRDAAAYMIAHGVKGRILNICSNTGFLPAKMAYGISKWGVRGLTAGLGRELARHGILLNAIAPGPTSTRMMFAEDGACCERSDIPIGRYSYPSEIASLAAFLVSDTVGNIAGEVIVADGGER